MLDERNEEYVAVDVAEMDITNAEMVEKVFEEVKPTLVYHCAAYTLLMQQRMKEKSWILPSMLLVQKMLRSI